MFIAVGINVGTPAARHTAFGSIKVPAAPVFKRLLHILPKRFQMISVYNVIYKVLVLIKKTSEANMLVDAILHGYWPSTAQVCGTASRSNRDSMRLVRC